MVWVAPAVAEKHKTLNSPVAIMARGLLVAAFLCAIAARGAADTVISGSLATIANTQSWVLGG